MEGLFIMVGAGIKKTIKKQCNTPGLEIDVGIIAPKVKHREQ